MYTTVNEAKPWVGYFLCFFDTARLACPFWLARSCCSVLLALLFSPCLPWAAWFCLLVWLLVSCFWLLGASGCWSPWCFQVCWQLAGSALLGLLLGVSCQLLLAACWLFIARLLVGFALGLHFELGSCCCNLLRVTQWSGFSRSPL